MFRQDFTCPALLKDNACSTCKGLSPSMAGLSIPFHFIQHCHWPGPRSLATTCGVSVDVLSCRYLDVSVPCVRFLHPMYSGADTLSQCLETQAVHKTDWIFQAFKVGCPIRRSMDQSLFAAPHSLSQRITSFFACACQGIHQMPLEHLFVLIVYAHHIVAHKRQTRLPFTTRSFFDDIDVFGTVFFEGTPVHLEAIPLRPASRDIIR